jgi:hypothetical protein
MTRTGHLLKAEAALGQAIEHLRRADEDDLAADLATYETQINDLMPVGDRATRMYNAFA